MAVSIRVKTGKNTFVDIQNRIFSDLISKGIGSKHFSNVLDRINSYREKYGMKPIKKGKFKRLLNDLKHEKIIKDETFLEQLSDACNYVSRELSNHEFSKHKQD